MHQAPARRPGLPAGAAVRGAAAQAVEPAQLQGPRQSARDAAGRRALQQEAIPDHRARSVLLLLFFLYYCLVLYGRFLRIIFCIYLYIYFLGLFIVFGSLRSLYTDN